MRLIITDTPPRVDILGQTGHWSDWDIQAFAERYGNRLNREIADPTIIPALAGAVCYDSFDNRAGRTNEEYLDASVIAHGHESVLEHFTYNFGISHLPRTTLMELTRHRVGVAYSWRSTRYTDSWIEYIVPPNMRGTDLEQTFRAQAHKNFELYRVISGELQGETELTRKQRKEAARSVLWSCVGTQGVFTVNVRELRHILLLRTAEGADASFREFAWALWDAVAEDKNAFFPDFVIPEDRRRGITTRG